MKKYSNLLIITLFILSIIGLFLVSTEETNKYFKSMGYLVVGFSVFGITFLKRKQLKESN
jgi:predicted tellurium resistance membrane protein TerC